MYNNIYFQHVHNSDTVIDNFLLGPIYIPAKTKTAIGNCVIVCGVNMSYKKGLASWTR